MDAWYCGRRGCVMQEVMCLNPESRRMHAFVQDTLKIKPTCARYIENQTLCNSTIALGHTETFFLFYVFKKISKLFLAAIDITKSYLKMPPFLWSMAWAVSILKLALKIDFFVLVRLSSFCLTPFLGCKLELLLFFFQEVETETETQTPGRNFLLPSQHAWR